MLFRSVANNIQMLGLAKRDRVLDAAKVEKFAEISESDYEILRTKLLIGGNEYYFRLLKPENGRMVEMNETLAGKKLSGNVAVVEIRIRRPVIYTYHGKEDEEGKKSQHEAIAELTLYSPYYWRR